MGAAADKHYSMYRIGSLRLDMTIFLNLLFAR